MYEGEIIETCLFFLGALCQDAMSISIEHSCFFWCLFGRKYYRILD